MQALIDSADGLKAGARWQLSADGGSRPMWRRDGREIVYVSTGQQVMSVSVDEQNGQLVLGRPTELFEVGATAIALDATGDFARFLIAVGDEQPREPLRVVLGWMDE